MHRHSEPPALVILGASVRALAESAARAGWAVHAADLFCDLDLQAAAREAVAVHASADGGYPRGLAAAAAAFPSSAPWCYTGALENHPALIASIAAARPLAGNAADVVRGVRDPRQLAAAARAAGCGFPETRADPADVPLDGTFLVKPLASAGGRGIHRWRAACPPDATRPDGRRRPPRIWQRYVPGEPLSACYSMAGGSARLRGVSRQWIGAAWCHAAPFAWCGGLTLAPDDRTAPARMHDSLHGLGDVLAETFGLVGMVGVDLVVDATGRLSVIEVNPRPTASMELFERLGTLSVAADHVAAAGLAAPSPQACRPPPRRPGVWAKAVLFLTEATCVSEPLVAAIRSAAAPWTDADGGWPAVADIPRPGQTIDAGGPAVTVFAVGRTAPEAALLVRERVARIDAVVAAARRAAVQPAIRRAGRSAASEGST